MNVKCENVVRCANTNCAHNDGGYVCRHIVVAIGSNGQCALCKPKDRPTQDSRDTNVNRRKVDGGNPVESVPVPLSKLVPPLD